MAGVGGTLKSIGDWFRPSQARLEKETETKEFLTRVGRAPLTDFLEARSGRIGIFTLRNKYCSSWLWKYIC